jgi:hypothetical protein
MKNRVRSLCVLSLASITLGGCAVVASPVGNGAIYTQVHGPVDVGPASGASKHGRACAANYVGFVAVGDASIDAAKRNGGISTVASVDHDSFGVLGVYTRYCTIVSGG